MSELNDKITGIINSNSISINKRTLFGVWATAKEIEILLLESQVDVLNEVMDNNTWDDDQSATFKIKISKLTEQLNKLKQP